MNWVLTVLAPKEVPVRTLHEMKTLASSLDMTAAGRAHSAAQRLKALELSLTDTTWNRAQFFELLDPEGPALLERDERRRNGTRKLQGGKGHGLSKGGQKGEEKTGGKTETKGGKDGDPATSSKATSSKATSSKAAAHRGFAPHVEPGTLDFEIGYLGDSDDEGLPTGKAGSAFATSLINGLSMKLAQKDPDRDVLQVGQLTAVMAEKDSSLVLDSEDLQSAFNLFKLPLDWAAVRHMAHTIAKLLPYGDVRKDRELAEAEDHTICYLDDFHDTVSQEGDS
ncbi:unnamed protein product [Symbiodinium sp. CCMP2592]|nr:unnamed protein product [Symbiodinium sp. CCMP2592]